MTPLLATLLVGLGTAFTAVTGYREVRARWRLWRLTQAEKFVTQPLGDAVALGAGAGAISLYDVYAAADDHEAVLDVLADRYNHAIPADATPLEWAGYFESKFALGPESVDGVEHGLVGALGEQAAIEALNASPTFVENGWTAELFESRTHAGTDIRVVDVDGTVVDDIGYSVKSYANTEDFLKVAESSPESAYIVNHEVYADLAGNGGLDELSRQGIDVGDGGWSHMEHVSEARDTIEAFHDSADVAGHIPLLGLAVFGVRFVGNVRRLQAGKASAHEFGVDAVGDVARIGAATVSAAVMAKVGGAIGMAVAPGIGAIIGGGVGALLGVFGAGHFIEWIKNDWKYGRLVKDARAVGESAARRIMHAPVHVASSIADAALGRSTLAELRDDAESRLRTFTSELAVYRSEWSGPTPMGALALRHCEDLATAIAATEPAAMSVVSWLRSLIVVEDGNSEYGVLGEVIAANESTLADAFHPELRSSVDTYAIETKKYPNHPFRFRSPEGTVLDTKEVFAGVCQQKYAAALARIDREQLPIPGRGANRLFWWSGLALAAVGLLGAQSLGWF